MYYENILTISPLQVNKGEVVELILIDEGYHDYADVKLGVDYQHSLHVHGYSFYVVAMERHANMQENIELIYDVPKSKYFTTTYCTSC